MLLAAAGCSSQGSSAASSASPSARATVGVNSSGWADMLDKATGVRFSLPRRVNPETKQGVSAGLSARAYFEQVAGMELVVSIVHAAEPIPSGYANTIYHRVVSGLSQAGARDARLSSVAPATVSIGSALDATLTFIATNGSQNYWRMRTITKGAMFVQIQAIIFSRRGDSAAHRRVDAIFDRIAKSVVLTRG